MQNQDLITKFLTGRKVSYKTAWWIKNILVILITALFALYASAVIRNPKPPAVETPAGISAKENSSTLAGGNGENLSQEEMLMELRRDQEEQPEKEDQPDQEEQPDQEDQPNRGKGADQEDRSGEDESQNLRQEKEQWKLPDLTAGQIVTLALLFALMMFLLYEATYLWFLCLIFGPIIVFNMLLAIRENPRDALLAAGFGVLITLAGFLTMRPLKKRYEWEKLRVEMDE